MANIPGGVQVTGFISPTDDSDTYPVIDPIYGIGGWREVQSLAQRDAITDLRRRAGMVAWVIDTKEAWQLEDDLVTWTLLATGSGDAGIRRFPYTDSNYVVIPMVELSPTLTVWIMTTKMIPFTFNSFTFGSPTWNFTTKGILRETFDYVSEYDPDLKIMEITFNAGLHTGEVTFVV